MFRILIIFFIFLTSVSCKKKESDDSGSLSPVSKLELINSYTIDVPEPSGLSFGPARETLLTVSDHSGKIYEMDLQGEIIRIFDYTGNDLEGVTYNPDKNIVVVAEEGDHALIFIDYSTGNLLGTYIIDITLGSENKGLEGVSYNTNNKLYYIVNEMNPGMLITWDITGNISEDNLEFAIDYSGIFTDSDHSYLWIISDQSKSLYKCDYSANVLLTFYFDETKYEGIVVDNDLVYIVNDATARLNIYKITT